jgi:DNA-binding CsgD family transcriptional regulator
MAGRLTISDRDVRTMLRIATCPDDTAGGPDTPIPWSVLHGVRDLIRCDQIACFELDSDRQVLPWGQNVPDDPPEVRADDRQLAFWTHYADCVPCSYPDASGDLNSVTTFSDFYSQRQLHATGMYAEYFRPEGIEREVMLCLPSPHRRTRRLVLFRQAGPDFSDRDRALLTLLRPHLHAIYRNSTRAPAPELTGRQLELLRWVAAGHTNRQIARRMLVAESTVRKHLEHIFERLRVTSRAAAVARAFGTHPPD